MQCCSGKIGNGPLKLSEGLLKLESEHQPLLIMLENLLTLCEKIEAEGEKGPYFEELIGEVIEFTKKLEYHAVREEDYLFRMLEVYIGRDGGPIAVMENEHMQADLFISEFLEKAKNHSQLTSDEMIKNIIPIKNAYDTLLNHFSKEEQVLFPMAERMLSQEEKEELNQKISEKQS